MAPQIFAIVVGSMVLLSVQSSFLSQPSEKVKDTLGSFLDGLPLSYGKLQSLVQSIGRQFTSKTTTTKTYIFNEIFESVDCTGVVTRTEGYTHGECTPIINELTGEPEGSIMGICGNYNVGEGKDYASVTRYSSGNCDPSTIVAEGSVPLSTCVSVSTTHSKSYQTKCSSGSDLPIRHDSVVKLGYIDEVSCKREDLPLTFEATTVGICGESHSLISKSQCLMQSPMKLMYGSYEECIKYENTEGGFGSVGQVAVGGECVRSGGTSKNDFFHTTTCTQGDKRKKEESLQGRVVEGVANQYSVGIPTLMPTVSINCAQYSASNTNSNTDNYAECPIYACPGSYLYLSGCNGYCYGDQFLTLFDGNGNVVAENDDACGACAIIEYYTQGPCQVYSLHEGCYGSESCSGLITVSGGSVVTSTEPTPAPTPGPAFDCPYYQATNTNYDQQGYFTCSMYACPGSTLQVNGCNGACSGDQYIRLFDQYNNEVAASDDDCNDGTQCARLTYTTTEPCQVYNLHEGCYGSSTCGGYYAISGASESYGSPTQQPTPAPTGGFLCSPFDVSNTNYDLQYYSVCYINACPGSVITINGCDNCFGDQYFRLYDNQGNQLAYNDDYCGACSYIEYTTMEEACTSYQLNQGCYAQDNCGGTTHVSIVSEFASREGDVHEEAESAHEKDVFWNLEVTQTDSGTLRLDYSTIKSMRPPLGPTEADRKSLMGEAWAGVKGMAAWGLGESSIKDAKAALGAKGKGTITPTQQGVQRRSSCSVHWKEVTRDADGHLSGSVGRKGKAPCGLPYYLENVRAGRGYVFCLVAEKFSIGDEDVRVCSEVFWTSPWVAVAN